MQPDVRTISSDQEFRRRKVARLLAVTLFLALFAVTLELNAFGQHNAALISAIALFFALVVNYVLTLWVNGQWLVYENAQSTGSSILVLSIIFFGPLLLLLSCMCL